MRVNFFNCQGIHVPSRFSSHGLNNHFDATWPMTFWLAGADGIHCSIMIIICTPWIKIFLRERALSVYGAGCICSMRIS